VKSLYLVDEIIVATGGVAQNITTKNISSISIDSREIEKGALYVAIKGANFDGHDFVKAAIKNGAAAALVSKEKATSLAGLPIIIVPDALLGLEDIARLARIRSKAKIIAVTGSAGKTSTKEVLKEVLQKFGKTHASIRSFNNHWGVPLMLARMAQEVEFGIFEIGMNHANEITPLSKLVNPDIAIITNVAPAHLEQLGSLENIAKAKSEIFGGLKKLGIAVINIDHEQGDVLLDNAKKAGIKKIITYGFNKKANVEIVDVKANDKGMSALVCGSNMELDLEISNFGRHRLANASVALIVVNELGLELSRALKVLKNISEPQGRGQIIKLGSKANPLTLIDESFNANPLSMSLTLEVFKNMDCSSGKKILVLGDMLELGADSEGLHAALKRDVRAVGADNIFLIGQSMRALARELEDYEVSAKADKLLDIQARIINSLDFGDVIMVKGSKGTGLAGLVKEIRLKFEAIS
jgi:UDP-N-acetylmuramoyl-tripeptide--D-alanyl-D-alanine ligase